MRIRIPPDEINSLLLRMKAVSFELFSIRQTLQRAASGLDWEVNRRPEVDSLISKASIISENLSEEAYRISYYLKRVVDYFQEADSRFYNQFYEPFNKYNLHYLGSGMDNNAINRISLTSSFYDHNKSLDIIGFSSFNYSSSLRWIKENIF